MIIIGERINATRKHVGAAVSSKDEKYIIKEATEQEQFGAHMIDVNAGKSPEKEVEDMKWLMDLVQKHTKLPICIDSANAKAIAAALALNKNGRPLINSVTDEQPRIEAILPLVKQYDTMVVALLIDEKGVADTVARRMEIADSLVNKILKNGIKVEDIYVDPCIFPLSTNGINGLDAAESITKIKAKFPGIKTTCGLSNISYGLPLRSLINQAFVVMLMTAGLDSALIDPLDKKMVSLVYAAKALLNKDDYCMDYITAAREEKLT